MSNVDLKTDLFVNEASVDCAKEIWFKGLTIKFALFCWMTSINGLKTSDILAKRGIGNTVICPLCNEYSESHSHLFFECPISFWLIRQLLPNGNHFLFEPNIN